MADGRRTGVEEYTIKILSTLFDLDQRNEYVLFFNSWKYSGADFSWTEKFPNVKIKKFKLPNKLLNFLFWYSNWPKIDQMVGGADAVFFPNIIFGAVSKKTKLITTIHDLSFERYPEHFSLKRRLWHIFINPARICRRADRIIAVSASTKSDIQNLYKIRADKIKVVPNGVAEKFQIIDRNDEKLIKTKEKCDLPYKFILYFGTVEPRKNIIGIIRAYGALRKFARENKNEDLLKYKLVVAGERGWSSGKIYEEIKNSTFKNNIQLINSVCEKDKAYVYNLASLFVYPSFFEGFGFPPLEAMKCGVPVVCSNNSSLPEVAGNAAIMIDPDKPEEIYRAMKEILTNREFRETLIAKGLSQSKSFDWKRTAEETLRVLAGW
ncbi:MAG: hypothetical protein A2288_03415 [Candidatus Moranbacteria bacterium RIFOXYA12_FULL_44_15]|nr:MAG: hypothetical protein A2288_03415 [Candidatus Moranbacteria bacterium RIFOXYA12_FULL_44_15]